MAMYGAFSTSMLGMMSQARSLHNIGVNLANINTGGYKGTDTQFSTILSGTIQQVSDLGGVKPQEKVNVTKQGNIVSSSNATDVAISGRGFFMMNTAQDGTGEEVYGRDGSFEVTTVNDITVNGLNNQTVTTKDGYLTDKNGYFIQGWAYSNGTVNTSATPQSLRVDQYAFVDQFQATTTGSLNLNLPAGDAVNDVNEYDIAVYDSAGAQQSVKLNFTKTGVNTWNVTSTTSATPVAQVDTVTLAGTVGAGEVGDVYTVTINGTPFSYTTDGTEASLDQIRDQLISNINASGTVNSAVTASAGGTGVITITSDTAGTAFTTTSNATNGGATADNAATQATTTANGPTTTTSAATAMTFNSDGTLSTPTTLNLAVSFSGGSTATVALDISNMTQYDGDFLPVNYTKDGFAKANMKSFSFNEVGDVYGSFEDNTTRQIYRLSLAVFSNPNGLQQVNGNVFKLTPESGDATIVSAGNQGYASIMPNARELSNVDIADEFSKMMMTQTAYNASSTVFRTADEMTMTARDLKK